MVTIKKSADKYDSCNFCNSDTDIHIMTGDGKNMRLVVTICKQCLKQVSKYHEALNDATHTKGPGISRYEQEENDIIKGIIPH